MHSYRRNIRGIIDELFNNAIKAGATNIEASVSFDGDQVVIRVKDNGSGMDEETLKVVEKKLYQPRREELEDYYGSLAGQSFQGTGLSLVGMMTDRAEVKTSPGEGTEVAVYIKL